MSHASAKLEMAWTLNAIVLMEGPRRSPAPFQGSMLCVAFNHRMCHVQNTWISDAQI